MFECEAKGMSSRGTSVDNLREVSGGIGVVVDGGDGGARRPNDGMVVGVLLAFGFGCAKGSDGGDESKLGKDQVPSPKG